MHIIHWVGGLILLGVISSAALARDYVIMKNGDRITGEVEKIWNEEVFIEPKYGDTYAIELEYVAYIHTEEEFEVEIRPRPAHGNGIGPSWPRCGRQTCGHRRWRCPDLPARRGGQHAGDRGFLRLGSAQRHQRQRGERQHGHDQRPFLRDGGTEARRASAQTGVHPGRRQCRRATSPRIRPTFTTRTSGRLATTGSCVAPSPGPETRSGICRAGVSSTSVLAGTSGTIPSER